MAGSSGSIVSPLLLLVFALSVNGDSNKLETPLPKLEDLKIVVVGAGASGIAAAVRLLDLGFTNLTILEAEPRIGGRVFTVTTGDWKVDMGAHWVHGGPGNPVYDLAEPLGIVEESGDGVGSLTAAFSDGTHQNMSGDLLDDEDDFKGLVNVSLEQALRQRVGKELVEEYGGEKGAALLEHHLRLRCSLEGCDRLSDVSAGRNSDYLELNSSSTFGWKGQGYGTFLDLLLRRHDKSPGSPVDLSGKLKLKTEVKEIRWQGEDGKVHLSLSDGSQLTADKVIVTTSVAVLKRPGFFQPSLPKPHADALNGIGFGTVDKIILRFPEAWWPNNTQGFCPVWLNEDKKKYQAEYPWETEVLIFARERWSPLTLTAWLVGEAARDMERTPLQGVQRATVRLLRHFLGSKYNISEPVETLRSEWGTNPHFGGSYSYHSLASEGVDLGKLAQPLLSNTGKKVVFFGGEATHSVFYGTVQGAAEAGWREANHIYEIVKQGQENNN